MASPSYIEAAAAALILVVVYVAVLFLAARDAWRAARELHDELEFFHVFLKNEMEGLIIEIEHTISKLDIIAANELREAVSREIDNIQNILDRLEADLRERERIVQELGGRSASAITSIEKRASEALRASQASLERIREDLNRDCARIDSRLVYLDRHVSRLSNQLREALEKMSAIEDRVRELEEAWNASQQASTAQGGQPGNV